MILTMRWCRSDGVEILRLQYPGESEVVDLFESSAKRAADMVRQLSDVCQKGWKARGFRFN